MDSIESSKQPVANSLNSDHLYHNNNDSNNNNNSNSDSNNSNPLEQVPSNNLSISQETNTSDPESMVIENPLMHSPVDGTNLPNDNNSESQSQESEIISQSDLFQYNNHKECIFDDAAVFPSLHGDIPDVVKFDSENPDLLNHASVKALIVQLTSPDVIDYNLIYDFFITYRMFIDSDTVMNLLMTRLIWSLQYLNSNNPEDGKIGQLVLLRTFVVLRHWILNYFIDDFIHDLSLCDIFSTHLNEIIFLSHLISPAKVFEAKIFSDLKTHWVSSIIEFWKLELNFEDISKDIFHYKLPLASELLANNQHSNFKPLVKSSTDMSIHTNPSYRRSAMLSLYDQKSYHKCLVFDDSNPQMQTENPQLSINNLVVQHQSSRLSIMNKLNQYNFIKTKKMNNNSLSNNNVHDTSAGSGNNKQPIASPLKSTNKHNRMNLNDSSVGLKKTSNVTGDANTSINTTSHNPVEPKNGSNENISLSPVSIENVGFSTNGNVKLPTSKVTYIIPTTPVKKMEYIIRTPNVLNSRGRSGSMTSNTNEQWENPQPNRDTNNSDVNRKNSIRKMLEVWKKNKNHSNNSNEAIDKSMDETIEQDYIGNRMDILSARIIDELEFLISYYIQNDSSYNPTIAEGDSIDNTGIAYNNHNRDGRSNDEIDVESLDDSVDIVGSPAKPYRVSTAQLNSSLEGRVEQDEDEDEEPDVDINDLSELNIGKIDNLLSDQGSNGQGEKEEENDLFADTHEDFESDKAVSPNFANEIHEFSFQRPTSINWNDDGNLELENSQHQVSDSFNDNSQELPEPNLPKDLSGELQNTSESGPLGLAEPPFALHNNKGSRSSSISTPSNFTDYDAEMEDLGIALSPQSLKGQSAKRISFTTDTTANNRSSSSGAIKRMSRSSSLFKRDSIKSYVSYDSAFSVSRESVNQGHDMGNNLRKKAGVNNLRTLAGLPSERKSLETPVRVQSNSSVRRSIRYSAIAALTELPFNNMNDSKNSMDDAHALVLGDKKIARQSGVAGDASVFSVAMKSRTSMANSFKTLNEDSRAVSVASDSFKFSSATEDKDSEGDENTGDNESSKRSVAIPGISNGVLKELAAIPDESFHFNPVDFALGKLEGNKNDDSTTNSETTHVDLNNDTQDILEEINNADTQDIIDSSSQRDDISHDDLQPLTPRDRGRHLSIDSDPTPTARIMPGSGKSLETQTDNENVFIFSANYTNSTTHGSTKPTYNSPGSPDYRSPRLILENYNLSNELLTISKVTEGNLHISFILSYGLEELANHFTMIERDILQEIDWKELIELKWNKELTPVNSWLEIIVNEDYYNSNKGVNLVIARFNLMVNWIISEILLTKDQFERVQIISRFIHLGQNCLNLQNYSTLMQILLALTSEKIAKLKDTWKHLPPGDILLLKKLEELSSPLKNFINLRVSINKIQPSKGCIPFVGLYLSDLIFNTERPRFIKTSSNSSDKLINFARFRTSVHIVKSLSQSIEWSSYYDLEMNNELLSKCLYIRSLDEDEMNYCLSTMRDP